MRTGFARERKTSENVLMLIGSDLPHDIKENNLANKHITFLWEHVRCVESAKRYQEVISSLLERQAGK